MRRDKDCVRARRDWFADFTTKRPRPASKVENNVRKRIKKRKRKRKKEEKNEQL